MKTSVIEVRDMLSVLSVLGVEERIGKVAGVESVTLNYAAGSATVRYDETRLDIADIKSAVRHLGNEEVAPPPATAPSGGHEDHPTPDPAPAPSPSAASKPALAAAAAMPATAPPTRGGPEGGAPPKADPADE